LQAGEDKEAVVAMLTRVAPLYNRMYAAAKSALIPLPLEAMATIKKEAPPAFKFDPLWAAGAADWDTFKDEGFKIMSALSADARIATLSSPSLNAALAEELEEPAGEEQEREAGNEVAKEDRKEPQEDPAVNEVAKEDRKEPQDPAVNGAVKGEGEVEGKDEVPAAAAEEQGEAAAASKEPEVAAEEKEIVSPPVEEETSKATPPVSESVAPAVDAEPKTEPPAAEAGAEPVAGEASAKGEAAPEASSADTDPFAAFESLTIGNAVDTASPVKAAVKPAVVNSGGSPTPPPVEEGNWTSF
jgi:hypothetical protein